MKRQEVSAYLKLLSLKIEKKTQQNTYKKQKRSEDYG